MVLNSKVYITRPSGGVSSDPFISVYQYIRDMWDKVVIQTSSCYALTTYNGQLVMVGGDDPSIDAPTDKLWVMQEEEGQMRMRTQPLPLMHTKRSWASAVSTGDHLIVAGGWGESGYLSTVEVYDGHQWIEVESLPMACCNMKSVVHEGNWYLMGEFGQGKEVFCASLDSLIASTHSGRTGTSLWKRLPEAHFILSSAAVFGNCLISYNHWRIPSNFRHSCLHTLCTVMGACKRRAHCL